MHYDSPEAAYEAFFTHFNAEDAPAWANVMHYPHVRVSAGSGTSTGTGSDAYYETPENYSARASWDRLKADGWVRTQSIDPVRIHEAPEEFPDKVHLAGGWTRYNADDEPIRSNRVTYILTRIEGSWGIQARFGTDSFAESEDTAPFQQAALDIVERHLDAWDARAFPSCTALASYPLIEVGVGDVTRHQDSATYEASLTSQTWSATTTRKMRAHQVGRTGVNIAVTTTLQNGRREQAIFLIALRDDRWAIAARSRIPG